MIELRSVYREDQPKALELWTAVFLGVSRKFFDRYYSADPQYLAGDTVGAWNGGQLVGAVHVCRRTVDLNGSQLLFGGIANVATLPEFRGQGVSGRLLKQSIGLMEKIGCAYSLLETGYLTHYSKYGWERIDVPSPTVVLNPNLAAATYMRSGFRQCEDPAGILTRSIALFGAPLERNLAELAELWRTHARPIHTIRPDSYFSSWPFWNGTWLLAYPGCGYVFLSIPDSDDDPVLAEEWCASSPEVEAALFATAGAWALAQGRKRLRFAALPQYSGLAGLLEIGTAIEPTVSTFMIRPVSLARDAFNKIRDHYVSGRIAIWPADRF